MFVRHAGSTSGPGTSSDAFRNGQGGEVGGVRVQDRWIARWHGSFAGS